MPADFGYINARVKGQHSRLLGGSAYHELLELPDFPAFAKWLETSPYTADWQLAKARYDGLEAAEWAFENNFSGATGLLLKIAEGAPGRLVALLLRRWDLANLLAVVRGIALEWGGAEIARSLWPAGGLDHVRLKELAELPSLRAVADTLATWGDDFAGPLGASLDRYQRDKELAAVELSLQRSYYAQAFRELRGIGHDRGMLRAIFRREVDLANAKALRRLMAKPDLTAAAAQAYCIAGGATLTPAVFAALADPKGRGRTLRALRTSPYHALLNGGDPVALEPQFDRAFWRECARLYRRRPLAVDVVVGYLWQKYYELVNLRLLARAKFYGLPAEAVRQQLFLA
ncbi:MAG TPA: V-type ATPase subunit [Candidatus Edwardsbacteria bacterium]|nr:V-type ATPase subunit [Candidatus Edwardsbacteria bacterium]